MKIQTTQPFALADALAGTVVLSTTPGGANASTATPCMRDDTIDPEVNPPPTPPPPWPTTARVTLSGAVSCNPPGFTAGVPTTDPSELNGVYELTQQSPGLDYRFDGDVTVTLGDQPGDGIGCRIYGPAAQATSIGFPQNLSAPVDIVVASGAECSLANGSQGGSFRVQIPSPAA